MTSNRFHTLGPARQTMPLALVFTSRRLLTETSSVTASASTFAVRTESLTLRASRVTATLEKLPGYGHCAIHY